MQAPRHGWKTLDDSTKATTRQRIEAWLDTNMECHDKLLKLMESGMVLELVTGTQEASLPRSCTKLNLLADHILTKLLGKSNPALTIGMLRDLKSPTRRRRTSCECSRCRWSRTSR